MCIMRTGADENTLLRQADSPDTGMNENAKLHITSRVNIIWIRIKQFIVDFSFTKLFFST